jgi:cysteine synthase B
MGVSKFLREKNPEIQLLGVYPAEGSQIPGIRKWAKEYEPSIFNESAADQLLYVSRQDADDTAVRLGREEGIFAGISSGATLFEAMKLSQQVENATIVVIICDRGDRYISTGIYG